MSKSTLNQAVKVLIRYNTRNDNDNPSAWRVLIPVVEPDCKIEGLQYATYFADNIILDMPARTSEDQIASGVVKWHITTYGLVEWVGKDFYVKKPK